MRGRKKILAEDLENPRTEIVLNLLKAGAFLTLAFLFPGAGRGLNQLLKRKEEYEPWTKFDRRRLREVIKRLTKRKLLSIKEKNGELLVILTENGKEVTLKYNLKRIVIKKPEKWDGKWHVVIFDVKEEKHSLRDTLRRKMKTLGFFPLQESVFIHPYPCEKEIAFLRQVYNIGNEVSVFAATELEEEEYLKRHFRLT